jgi:hypothetical protein
VFFSAEATDYDQGIERRFSAPRFLAANTRRKPRQSTTRQSSVPSNKVLVIDGQAVIPKTPTLASVDPGRRVKKRSVDGSLVKGMTLCENSPSDHGKDRLARPIQVKENLPRQPLKSVPRWKWGYRFIPREREPYRKR